MRRLTRSETLVSQAEQVLRDAIRAGRFPGNRLPAAAALAEELGVSRETVRLAEEALEREGLLVKYRRKGTLLQPPAMRLARRRASLLGYLQADYADEVTRATASLMLEGALREAGRAGFQLAVRRAPHTGMDRALRELGEAARLGGVIFASFGEEKLLREALGMGIPVVLLDHDLNLARVSTVREDSSQATRLAVAHLASLGHRRIAHANWRRADLNPWRVAGYRQGLREAGLPARRAWEFSAEISEAGAARLLAELGAAEPRPSALVCFNNTLARLVLARARGLSVVGCGGEGMRGLACVQADWEAMGRCAVQVLRRAVRGHAPEHHRFPYVLRPGRSSSAISR